MLGDVAATTAQTSEALLSAMAAGDRDAFRTLYDRHRRQVHAFLYRRLGDAAEAEDILHDVMLQVWRSAPRFEGRARATTWILAIANNKAADHRRRRRPEPVTEPEDAETLPDESESAFAQAARQADARLLAACLERLPEERRAAVHLVFYEGLRYAEVGVVLQVAEGTVKARIHHAKRALLTCLRRAGLRGLTD